MKYHGPNVYDNLNVNFADCTYYDANFHYHGSIFTSLSVALLPRQHTDLQTHADVDSAAEARADGSRREAQTHEQLGERGGQLENGQIYRSVFV